MLTKDYLEYVCDENTYFVKIVDIIFFYFFNSVQVLYNPITSVTSYIEIVVNFEDNFKIWFSIFVINKLYLLGFINISLQ